MFFAVADGLKQGSSSVFSTASLVTFAAASRSDCKVLSRRERERCSAVVVLPTGGGWLGKKGAVRVRTAAEQIRLDLARSPSLMTWRCPDAQRWCHLAGGGEIGAGRRCKGLYCSRAMYCKLRSMGSVVDDWLCPPAPPPAVLVYPPASLLKHIVRIGALLLVNACTSRPESAPSHTRRRRRRR